MATRKPRKTTLKIDTKDQARTQFEVYRAGTTVKNGVTFAVYLVPEKSLIHEKVKLMLEG